MRAIMMFFQFLTVSLCLADTIQNVIYPVPELEGTTTDSGMHPTTYSLVNYSTVFIGNDSNLSIHRHNTPYFLSFLLENVPDGYQLTTAKLFMTIEHTVGNDVEGEWPKFNYDEIIDWEEDYPLAISWASYTEPFNYLADVCPIYDIIGFIDNSQPTGTRETDLTETYQTLLDSGSEMLQLRIEVQGLGYDGDNFQDGVWFYTSLYENNEMYKPHLLVAFESLSAEEQETIGREISLKVYPNPLNTAKAADRNSGSKINFSLPQDDKINITVYNMKGQKIATLLDEFVKKGEHVIFWDTRNKDGSEVSAGLYLFKIHTTKKSLAKKILILK